MPTFVRPILGIAAIGILLYVIDVHTVIAALRDIRLIDLVYLLVLSIALILVSVMKWRAFLHRLGIQASIVHLFRLYLVGYFVNLITPSSLGGDVVRSIYVGNNVDKVRAVSATLLERYTGLLAMVFMSLIAVFFAPQVTTQVRTLTFVVGFATLAITAALLTGQLVRLSALLRVPLKIHTKLERLQEGLHWGLSDRSLLLKAAVLSISFHLLTIVNTAAVGHAVGWETIPWSDLLVVVPLILLVGAIPISPQGLGIQEGAFLFFLHSVGATTGQALAIGLVLRAKSYVLAAVGGVMWLGVSKRHRAHPDEDSELPEYPTL
jgi:uncharacterized protein (TIRG00374 family)